MPHVYMCAWTLYFFNSLINTQTFWRVLTASVDSCAEIKSAPSQLARDRVPLYSCVQIKNALSQLCGKRVPHDSCAEIKSAP